MSSDREALRALNSDMGVFEFRGDRAALATAIAPELAFQRADVRKSIDNRQRYLEKVAPSEDRDTAIETIDVVGNRAVVKCVVTMKVSKKKFHNLRLCVKVEGQWRVLGWANEEQTPA